MISICIATYNGEKFIAEQLTSILSQIGLDDEIIISDDGSTDQTLHIIRSFSDKRIKILHHKKKSVKRSFFYTTLNFENALKCAKGEYVFLSDQDDVWNPDKVEKCMRLLQDYDLVLHDATIVNENLSIIEPSYFKINQSQKGIIKNVIKNSYLGCCMVFRKEVLKKSIPFPNAEIPHDIWIGLVAEYYFNVYFYKKKLVKYRRHGSNLSSSGQKSINSFRYKILYRFIIIVHLIKKITRK